MGKRAILISIIMLIASSSLVVTADEDDVIIIRINTDASVDTEYVLIIIRAKLIGIDVNETSLDFGFMKFDTEKYTSTDRFKATNTGNYPEDVYVSANTTNWALGTSPNIDQMVFSMKTVGGNFSSWEPIADGDNDKIADNLPGFSNFTFGVKAHSPTSATLFDKQWLTVNVSAVIV